jgi:hypothetical protein
VFPTENERRITFVILASIIGLILGLVVGAKTGSLSEYLPPLVTLVAAFLGAWTAYLLQEKKERRKEISVQVEAGNRAIFALIRCHNRFLSIQQQAIDEFRQHPARYVAIKPLIGGASCELDLDFDSLSFLFKSEKPNLLNVLSAIQAEVESTILLIEERSNIHCGEVQPKAECGGFRVDRDISLSEIEEVLGYRLTETMKSLTDQLIQFVDQIVKDTGEAVNELSGIMKAEFRGHAIVGMTKPNPYEPSRNQ